MKKDEINSLKELREARRQLELKEAILKNTITRQVKHSIHSTGAGFSRFTPSTNTQRMVQIGMVGYSIYQQVSTYQKMASEGKKTQPNWVKLAQSAMELLVPK